MASPIEFVFFGKPPGGLSLQEVKEGCRAAARGQIPDDLARRLQPASVVTPGPGGWGFGRCVTLLDENCVSEMRTVGQLWASGYAATLRKNASLAGSLLSRLRRTPGWSRGDAEAILIAGLVLDLGVGQQLRARLAAALEPERFSVWAFRGGLGSRNSFGVQAWRDPAKAVLARLWGQATARSPDPGFDESDVRLLRIAFEKQGFFLERPPEQLHEAALKLRFLRFLERDGNQAAVRLPVLSGPSGRAVLAGVARLSRRLASEVTMPALREAQRRLAGSMPAKLMRAPFVRLLMEFALDQVIADGWMPPFPVQAGPSWGTWLELTGDRFLTAETVAEDGSAATAG